MRFSRYVLVALVTALAFGATGCKPGYIKANDLEDKEQGPRHCAMRCEELGMEMGALVLSSDQLPSCACVPKRTNDAPRGTAEGAAASSGAYAIALAAAAAREQQRQRQQQQAAASRR